MIPDKVTLLHFSDIQPSIAVHIVDGGSEVHFPIVGPLCQRSTHSSALTASTLEDILPGLNSSSWVVVDKDGFVLFGVPTGPDCKHNSPVLICGVHSRISRHGSCERKDCIAMYLTARVIDQLT
jgi:hypothetical protein